MNKYEPTMFQEYPIFLSQIPFPAKIKEASTPGQAMLQTLDPNIPESSKKLVYWRSLDRQHMKQLKKTMRRL